MHSFNTGTRNLADIHYCQLLSNGFNLGTISVPLFGSITGTHSIITNIICMHDIHACITIGIVYFV